MDGNTMAKESGQSVTNKVGPGKYAELHSVTRQCEKRYQVRQAQPRAMSCACLCFCLLGATPAGSWSAMRDCVLCLRLATCLLLLAPWLLHVMLCCSPGKQWRSKKAARHMCSFRCRRVPIVMEGWVGLCTDGDPNSADGDRTKWNTFLPLYDFVSKDKVTHWLSLEMNVDSTDVQVNNLPSHCLALPTRTVQGMFYRAQAAGRAIHALMRNAVGQVIAHNAPTKPSVSKEMVEKELAAAKEPIKPSVSKENGA